MKTNILYIGADHAGFKLKEKLKKYFQAKKIPFVDVGNLKFEKTDDYPDYGYKLAKRVVTDSAKGVLICGSSLGVCIAANKVKGARAVPGFDAAEVVLSREHNDANILCLSGWRLPLKDAIKMTQLFMSARLSSAKRHHRRLKKIKSIEDKNFR
jgi:ribose 5-phosphate isomerase B